MSSKTWAIIVVHYTKNECEVEWYGPYNYERTCKKIATILREIGNEELSQSVLDGEWIPDDDDDGFGYDDVGLRIEAQCLQ